MRHRALLPCLALSLVCASCAPFGDNTDLQRRVDEQDIQLRQMQPQQADTWNEVQAMREEINQLKGQLAQLNQNSAQPQATAQDGQPLAPDAAQTRPNAGIPLTQGEPYAGITPNPGNAPDSSAYAVNQPSQAANAAAAPEAGAYGLPPDPIQQHPAAPNESTWGMADPKPAPEAKKDLALALLESGQNDFKARKYSAAERSFSDFLKNYPKHDKAAEAQYNLGECYFASNNFPQAALAYDDVIRKYPKSSFLQAAYLKEGIAFSKMGKPEAARLRLNELIKKYPNSAEAKRASAFLKTNK